MTLLKPTVHILNQGNKLKRSANIELLFSVIRLIYAALGEVAERSNAAVLKTVEGLSPPRVRIPASPPLLPHFLSATTDLV